MDIWQQKLIKFWSRDTLICDNVSGSGSPTPPGVEFWKTKTRFYPPGHRGMKKTTALIVAGYSFHYVKMVIQKKNGDSRKTV